MLQEMKLKDHYRTKIHVHSKTKKWKTDQIVIFDIQEIMILSYNSDCGFTCYTWGLNRLEYLRGMLELRRHFETPCGSYMGDNTLESM